jgi:hypothetical protein
MTHMVLIGTFGRQEPGEAVESVLISSPCIRQDRCVLSHTAMVVCFTVVMKRVILFNLLSLISYSERVCVSFGHQVCVCWYTPAASS